MSARPPGPVSLRSDGSVELRLKVVPGGSRDEVVGPLGDRVKVRVGAPPDRGAANRAVLRLLAARLGLSPGAVTLVSGPATPLKVVALRGTTPAAVAAALGLPGP